MWDKRRYRWDCGKKNRLEANIIDEKSVITYITLKYLFIPPSTKWQKEIWGCSGRRLKYIKKSGPTYHITNKEFENSLRQLRYSGDGNCLFRAFSFMITRKENQHNAVRQLICYFIECNQRNIGGKILQLI